MIRLMVTQNVVTVADHKNGESLERVVWDGQNLIVVEMQVSYLSSGKQCKSIDCSKDWALPIATSKTKFGQLLFCNLWEAVML